MRITLSSLDGRAFDVAVIGAGINGASAAQQLAAAGYDVLLVDKADFASGSSGRSSRLLHCGLRYLAPGGSMWDFLRHPARLGTALRMSRQAMIARSEFVRDAEARTRTITFGFPIWRGGSYSAWQIDLAFRALAALGPSEPPLGYRRLAPAEVALAPLFNRLRDQARLV
ncbi:MAG: FAD-dependent oxidoreductase, partial [Alphaproteobacteria bacterium]